jgi:ectoine hydroxylase-related dioxygenase (phytanoyl-CoA dioxygenase family)
MLTGCEQPIISRSQRETFERFGVLRLESFLPAAKVALAREALFLHLEQEGVWRDGRWQLDHLGPSTALNAGAHLLDGLKRCRELARLVAEEVAQAVGELLGGRRALAMMDRPQILFTLPNATEWSVPASVWHTDLPRLPDGGIPGVQVFTFLDTVVPGGGGTLVVAGSHRLLNEELRISSKELKKRLRREPYFRDLMSKGVGARERFLHEPGRVGEVELQVVEIHGEPGDVFLMDLRVLHTVAPNAAPTPRIMLTQRFLLASLHGAAYGGVEAGEPEPA